MQSAGPKHLANMSGSDFWYKQSKAVLQEIKQTEPLTILHRTPADGSCFFWAIVELLKSSRYQSQLPGYITPDEYEDDQSLRLAIVNYVSQLYDAALLDPHDAENMMVIEAVDVYVSNNVDDEDENDAATWERLKIKMKTPKVTAEEISFAMEHNILGMI